MSRRTAAVYAGIGVIVLVIGVVWLARRSHSEDVSGTLRAIESTISAIPPFEGATVQVSRVDATCADPAFGDQPSVVVKYGLPDTTTDPSGVVGYYAGAMGARSWSTDQQSANTARFSGVVDAENVKLFVTVSPSSGTSGASYQLWGRLQRTVC